MRTDDDVAEPQAPPGAEGSKASSTRERILDIAMDLFTEQGYDGTSLREIAERLGVTKAAIYYHFASKDDILMALHMRLHEFGRDAMAKIASAPVTLAVWGELLDHVVGQMLSQRQLFLMHERNQAALEKLHREDHEADHEDFRAGFLRIVEDPRVPLGDRVKMACSFGAAFAGVFMSGEAFKDTPTATLRELLRDAVDAVLAASTPDR